MPFDKPGALSPQVPSSIGEIRIPDGWNDDCAGAESDMIWEGNPNCDRESPVELKSPVPERLSRDAVRSGPQILGDRFEDVRYSQRS
jgi:hypothetical protein